MNKVLYVQLCNTITNQTKAWHSKKSRKYSEEGKRKEKKYIREKNEWVVERNGNDSTSINENKIYSNLDQ